MNHQPISPKKAIAIIGLGFALLVAVISAVYWFTSSQDNPEGDSLVIKNLSDYTKGKPTDKDTLNHIEHMLHMTVNLNVKEPVGDKSIDDILVRDGTFSQEYNEEKTIHTVKFIVDIESLKQSYDVSYQWSSANKYSAELDEWGTVVKCLPVEKLIYGDFSCKDMFSEMQAVTNDPLLEKVLPYEGDFYTIRHYVGDDGAPVISVQIMMNTSGERTKKQFAMYKKEAQNWLTSQGVKIDDYLIIYRNLSNDIVVDESDDGSPEGEGR